MAISQAKNLNIWGNRLAWTLYAGFPYPVGAMVAFI
jgi:hypothetical protein